MSWTSTAVISVSGPNDIQRIAGREPMPGAVLRPRHRCALGVALVHDHLRAGTNADFFSVIDERRCPSTSSERSAAFRYRHSVEPETCQARGTSCEPMTCAGWAPAG